MIHHLSKKVFLKVGLENLRKEREKQKKERAERELAEKKRKEEEMEAQRLADLVQIKKRLKVFSVQLDEKRSRILWNQKGFKNSGEVHERITWEW